MKNGNEHPVFLKEDFHRLGNAQRALLHRLSALGALAVAVTWIAIRL